VELQKNAFFATFAAKEPEQETSPLSVTILKLALIGQMFLFFPLGLIIKICFRARGARNKTYINHKQCIIYTRRKITTIGNLNLWAPEGRIFFIIHHGG